MQYVTIPKAARQSPYPILRILNPGGGLNNLVSDNLIGDTEASDLNNIMFVESGCPSKATGTAPWGTGLVNHPKGLGCFYVPGGGARYVVTIDGANLVATTGPGSSWSTISGVSFTTGKGVTFTQAQNLLFIWNGTDSGATWDGTTLQRSGTMPSASYSIYYQGLHFASGTGTQQNRLYIAASTDATKFTTSATGNEPNNSTQVPGSTVYNAAPATGTDANFIDVNAGDGQPITGLAKFNADLIIFKTNSIYQLTIDSTGTPVVTPIITYLGAVSHRSIDNVDNDVFYLTRLGWFVLGYEPDYFTLIRTNELSARIHPIVNTINQDNLAQCTSIYAPYVFYSSVPSGGSSTNNLTVTYDRRYGAWSKLDFVHANAFTVFVDSSNQQHILYAADDTNMVYELNGGYSNNGAAIDGYWTSKAYDAKMPDVYKRFIDITLLFRQITGTITITLIDDTGATVHSSQIGTGTPDGGIASVGPIGSEMFGGNSAYNTVGDPFAPGSGTTTDTSTTNNVPYRIKLNVTARTLKVKVENANLSETFTLLGIFIAYRMYSHFKFPSDLKVQ